MHRIPIAGLAAAGLTLSIGMALAKRGVVGPLWDPLVATDADGWIVPPLGSLAPEVDVAGFATLLLTSILGPRDRWRTHRSLALAMTASAFLVAISIVTRWSIHYATYGRTSAAFLLALACAVAALPLAIRESSASFATFPGSARARGGRPQSSWVGVGSIFLGVWLLLVPESMSSMTAAQHAHLVGAPVAAIGALSLAPEMRAARWANAMIGAWLVAAPLIHGYDVRGAIHSMTIGTMLVVASVVLVETEARRPRSGGRVGT